MIPKFWSSYGHRQKSRLFYSFTARGYNSSNIPHYQTHFYPWIQESIPLFTHSELANVMLGLMFLENKEEEIWKAVVKNINKQQYVVPMTHFFTHKMALYYLDGLFPEWNLDGLHKAMRFGEDYFSTMRLKKYQTSETFMEFYRVLHFKLNLNAKPQMEWENLFVVDFAILPQKVGIYLITSKDCLPDSKEPRPLFKLKKFIMEKGNWGIYLCDWEEFLRQGENKLNWLFNDFMKVLFYVSYSINFLIILEYKIFIFAFDEGKIFELLFFFLGFYVFYFFYERTKKIIHLTISLLRFTKKELLIG